MATVTVAETTHAVVEAFIELQETNRGTELASILTSDAVLDLNVQQRRLQVGGGPAIAAAFAQTYPAGFRTVACRWEPTPSGAIIEYDGYDVEHDTYYRHLALVKLRDGRVGELTIYRTGPRDHETVDGEQRGAPVVDVGEHTGAADARTVDASTVRPGQLERVMARAMGELAVLANAPLKVLGRELGLWRALAGAGPSTPAAVAARTGLVERYVREWLFAQAASGWLMYDQADDTFTLDAASAAVIADEDSPAYFGLLTSEGMATTFFAELDRLERAFREGGGFGWGDHAHTFLDEQAAFTRPFYEQFLTGVWIPALDGVAERLQRGGRVADIGCGYGVSAILLGQGFPNARVVGFDPDDHSIAQARRRAMGAGIADRVSFEVAGATEVTGSYDLVSITDALHDMGDPVAAVRHARGLLAAGGTLMVIDVGVTGRFAEDIANPYTPLGYAISTQVCLPSSLGQPGAAGLGTMAGVDRIVEVLHDAGFSRVRRVAEDTPLVAVLEARP
jgi:SAM-dependent methyltransferase